MAVIKVVPHIDDNITGVDVEFTDNIYSVWTTLVTNDPVANYPRKFSDSRITENTYVRFRVRDSLGGISDWSVAARPVYTNKPEPDTNLCYIYGRLYNIETQEPLNSPTITFEYQSGSALNGAPLVRKREIEGDNYGWFIVPLTPGCVYSVSCPAASLEKDITIPASYNAKLGVL